MTLNDDEVSYSESLKKRISKCWSFKVGLLKLWERTDSQIVDLLKWAPARPMPVLICVYVCVCVCACLLHMLLRVCTAHLSWGHRAASQHANFSLLLTGWYTNFEINNKCQPIPSIPKHRHGQSNSSFRDCHPQHQVTHKEDEDKGVYVFMYKSSVTCVCVFSIFIWPAFCL